MPLIIGILVLVVLLGLGFMLAINLVGLLLTLLVAGLIGAGADRFVPGELPGGAVGAVIAGILGGFVGGVLFRLLGLGAGPEILGVHVLPAFVGALVVVGGAEVLTGSRRRTRALP